MAEETAADAPRILVVDDDPVIRVLSTRALTALGCEVEEAEDGQQALSMIDRSAPDLVLLDVEMPGISGFETCALIRERDPGREIPVLIATGHTDSDTIEKAFQSGATDFITKPLDWQLLQHRARFLLRASTVSSDLRRTLSELATSEDRLANAQRLARIGNWEWTPGGEEMIWSEEMYRILEIEMRPGASTYQGFLESVHGEDRATVAKAMQEAACETTAFTLDHRILTPSGGERIVSQQAEVVRGVDGGTDRINGTIQDITERRRAEEQIRYLAYYDSLTGLPNRRMLNEHLGRVLERAREHDQKMALLFLDLDRFKRVNDTLGHGIGDELLRALAERLLAKVRQTDYVGRQSATSATISRLGGDEFTVVLSELGDSEDAEHVARRILEGLRQPFSLQGHDLVMSASIGIAVYPTDGSDADTLLRKADTAMYHAKQRGRGIYQFFTESMNTKAMRNLRLESALRGAVDRDELRLLYQPQLNLKTGAITGVEALIRWHSPDFGLVMPGEFIPVAEETDLILRIGEWVLKTACAQGRAWQQAGLPPLRMASNISSQQVRKPELVDLVQATLDESGFDPTMLELEITESALIGDDPAVVDTLQRVKRLGVRLALDDFGTGFSSLSHLVRFPIDTLKIDQSFVQRVGIERQADAIIAAVVAMAHRLNLAVIAEGVETWEQEQFLRSEGCDEFQGYLFSRPIEVDALVALLRPEKIERPDQV